jgi:hypothetical protein
MQQRCIRDAAEMQQISPCSRDAAEMQQRCSRDAAEMQQRCSRDAADLSVQQISQKCSAAADKVLLQRRREIRCRKVCFAAHPKRIGGLQRSRSPVGLWKYLKGFSSKRNWKVFSFATC